MPTQKAYSFMNPQDVQIVNLTSCHEQMNALKLKAVEWNLLKL